MKQYLFFMLALASVLLAHAQNPGIPYQATLLAPETQLPGANSGIIPLKNTDVCLRFTFKSASGIEYQETQTATTKEFGRIDLVIGNGTPVLGSFAGINWDGNPKTMEVDIDYNGLCANFEPLAINEFQYVPYAFFALNAGGGSTTPPTITANTNPIIPGDLTIGTNNLLINVDDADSDPNNEIELPLTAAINQVLTWDGSAWVAKNNPVDADSDPTNEIQDLTITGNTLKITGNSSATDIDLTPYLDNTDNQIIVSADTGNLITAGTDLGALITSIDDADADPANEIQDLAITANTLKITGNASASDIDLTPYLDNTDNQIIVSADAGNLITAGTDLGAIITSIDDADADPTNEIQDLEEVLTQNNDAGGLKIANLLDPTLAQDASTKAYVDAEISAVNLSVDGINTLGDGKIYVGDATNVAAEVSLSGDISMTNAGVTTIANDAITTIKISDANVTDAKLAAGIDATKLADGTVSNTELQYIGTLTSDAQTQITDLNTLADGKIYVGDATNVAAEVSLSGDISMTNTGVTTIANDAVTMVKLGDIYYGIHRWVEVSGAATTSNDIVVNGLNKALVHETSIVIVTINQNTTGTTVFVQSAKVISANSIRISLNSALTINDSLSYFIITP